MKRQDKWKLVVIGMVVLLLIAFGVTVVLAQGDEGEDPSEPAGDEVAAGQMAPLAGIRQRLAAVIDHQQLLADSLDITVEELIAAQNEARSAAIDILLEEGLISEDKAEIMRAVIDLQGILDREEILASALDISVEELRQAREQGKRVGELAQEQDKTPREMAAALKLAVQAFIQQAADDGIISQDQADILLDAELPGLRLFGRAFAPGLSQNLRRQRPGPFRSFDGWMQFEGRFRAFVPPGQQ